MSSFESTFQIITAKLKPKPVPNHTVCKRCGKNERAKQRAICRECVLIRQTELYRDKRK